MSGDQTLTLKVSLRDMATVKLLLLQLNLLRDALVVEANPAAERLEQIIRSFSHEMSDGGPDDGDQAP